MGNQQPKEKSMLSISNADHKVFEPEFFNCNDDFDISPDSWRQVPLTNRFEIDTNSLSSFTVSEPKQEFIVAQSDFTSSRPYSHLSVKKGETLKFKCYSPDKMWVNVKRLDDKVTGWIPTSVAGDIIEDGYSSDSYLQQFDWYHGAVQRSFAEYLLNSGINGSFLVRESESNPGLRSISLRYNGTILHFRISKDSNNRYYVSDTQRFDSIPKLIEFHSKHADTLPCQLLYAAPKRAKATVFGVVENDSSDNWEIDRTEILMKDQLGGGQYGIVYEGYWQRHNITVAVKTVRADITVTDDFLEEARLMKSLQHPNLVRLLGVCTREPPDYIITEFMENGNLLDYLRIRPKEELPPPVLLYMAIQISAGMEYLEEHNFIHRDLAARNCLVGQDNIVKVADFGLARCMERDDTYTAHIGSKFPIKWTAPEGLAYNLFSTKSDVWAFGILLWELATYGMTPYPGTELQDVYVYLQNDNIMPRPSGCPENIYELMKQCWQWQPEKRPTFKNLHLKLETMLSNINEQVDLEMAKEKSLIDISLTNPSSVDDLLPNQSDISFKRKEAPVPPVRTITLKEISLESNLVRTSPSLLGPLISTNDLITIHNDVLPPLPPLLDDTSSNQGRYKPPVSRYKPKGLESSETPRLSVHQNQAIDNNSALIVTPRSTINANLKPIPKIPQDVTNDVVKRARSELFDSRPSFQSELRSRLKLQQRADDNNKVTNDNLKEETEQRGNIVWPMRTSMSHVTNQGNITHSNATFVNNGTNQTTTILTQPNKRMSWTGPSSTHNLLKKKPIKMTPLPSFSTLNLSIETKEEEEEEEADIDDFISKDNLLTELNGLCQELVNLGLRATDVSTDKVSALVEKLETVHVGATRYCNGSINSAKIKFKCIELCECLRKGIEGLRRHLKPFDQASVLTIGNGIKTCLSDLKTLIESIS